MNRVGVAVIGVGHVGALHAENLVMSVKEAEVKAVADISEEAAGKVTRSLGIGKAYRNYHDVLKDREIDAVVIATPNHLHYEAIMAAIDAAKHVFCEKPLTLTLEEADDVIRRIGESGIKLQVGYNRRFDPSYLKAKKLIDEGEVGKPLIIHSHTRDPGPPRGEWDINPQLSGGIFVATCSHDFDMCRWLAGSDVKTVYADGGALVFEEQKKWGNQDNVMISLTFSNGALGSVDASWACSYGYDVGAEVLGSEGAVRIGKERETNITLLKKTWVSHDYPHWYKERFYESYVDEIRDFVDCVAKDKEPKVTAQDGRAALEVALAARKSLWQERPVSLPL